MLSGNRLNGYLQHELADDREVAAELKATDYARTDVEGDDDASQSRIETQYVDKNEDQGDVWECDETYGNGTHANTTDKSHAYQLSDFQDTETEPAYAQLDVEDDDPQNYGSAESDERADLDPYSDEDILAKIEIRHVEGKGRCMFAKRDYLAGALIFVEKPLCTATSQLDPPLWEELSLLHAEEPFSLPVPWQIGALYTLKRMRESDRVKVLDKWVGTDCRPSADAKRVCRHFNMEEQLDLYERVLQIWRFNSFGHHEEEEGLVLYHRISMCAHDCGSSASWHYGNQRSFALRARHFIPKGGEITISYIGDDELYKTTQSRRFRLANWLFHCDCGRCSLPIDRTRGIRCAACGVGTCWFKTETSPLVTTAREHDKHYAAPCTMCLAPMTQERIQKYINFETAYLQRLKECDTNDIADVEAVYVEAQRVFTSHTVLNRLEHMLQEGYKREGRFDEALICLERRIRYHESVSPLPSYTLAWLYETYGDIATDKQTALGYDESDDNVDTSFPFRRLLAINAYETAMNMLYVLCGWHHEYTESAYVSSFHDGFMTKVTFAEKVDPRQRLGSISRKSRRKRRRRKLMQQ